MTTPPVRDRNVRALRRGLQILAEVSGSSGIRAGEIAGRLRLARPTVYRLLETLEEEGYVCRSASDDRFRVTLRARGLGAGYDGSSALSQAAGAVLTDLGQRLVWPVDLVTCDGGAMVVLESTHARSPLSLDRGMIGRRLPLLRTAGGRAYLAFCSPGERGGLLDVVRSVDAAADRPILKPGSIESLVKTVCAAGYATRSNAGSPIDGTSASKTYSIAVPILHGGGVHGCLVVIWFARVLTFAEAARQFVKPMQEAALAVGRRLAA